MIPGTLRGSLFLFAVVCWWRCDGATKRRRNETRRHARSRTNGRKHTPRGSAQAQKEHPEPDERGRHGVPGAARTEKREP